METVVVPVEQRAAARTVRRPEPCALVIFGASGGLTQTKLMPALYHLSRRELLPERFALVGYARTAMDRTAFIDAMRKGVNDADEKAWGDFAQNLAYLPGTYQAAADFKRLKALLDDLDKRRGTQGNRLYYLALPPEVVPDVVNNLAAAEMIQPPQPAPFTRVVFEKPFGHDLESAEDLNRLVEQVLAESQAFRIDHYLAKETVQNILVFRLANSFLEPLWNRQHLDHVQITAAEDIGLEGRGGFYDQAGVVRDVAQSHLLQVLSLVAMEPPIGWDADAIRDQKMQVFRSLRPLAPEDVARDVVPGQYRGYREEPKVAADSKTPTFVAFRVFIDNWRWQGVPFYVRAGKRLARRLTEVTMQFSEIPLCLFGRRDVCAAIEPNVLTLRLHPDEGIDLEFTQKVPGEDLDVRRATMRFRYASEFGGEPPEAYQRVLLDCMRGDTTLFIRDDAIEASWRFVMPILEAWEKGALPEFPNYEPGSWGPRAADQLLARDGRQWRNR